MSNQGPEGLEPNPLGRQVQVNIPLTMLCEGFLEVFLKRGLNPEIGVDAAGLDRFSPEEVRPVAAALQGHGLRVTLHGPFMDLSPGSPDPVVWTLTRKRFEGLLRLVPVFRPILVVCHAGYDARRYHFMRDAWIERSVTFWSWLSSCLRAEGSRLVLENVYEEVPEDLWTLLERLRDEEVGLCLDPGHQSAFSKASLSSWVERLEPFIRQLHLHDNLGDHDHHLALGEGRIDFVWLLQYLREHRDTPPLITLEPHREEDLAPSLAYLSRIWPW
jgi:sugar phosphate isomerase/epimerase